MIKVYLHPSHLPVLLRGETLSATEMVQEELWYYLMD